MQNARLIACCALVFLGTAYTLFIVFDTAMYHDSSKYVLSILLLPLATAQNTTIDLRWHPPKRTWINDLSKVLNGTETNSFIFNSSVLPSGTPYGTYNWCNMPHVRPQEYAKPSSGYKLEYVEVVRNPSSIFFMLAGWLMA